MLQWIHRHLKTVKASLAIGGVMLVAVFFISLFFQIPAAQAQESAASMGAVAEGVEVIREPLGLASTDIRIIVARIIRVALSLIGIILVVLIIYGGFLWMTAGGNEEQVGKAKNVLKNAIIGLVIVLSAYSIALFVFRMFGYELAEEAPTGAPPNTENFQGSGALGRVLRDHYPMRDQTGVPRNTKIIVTFRRPVDVSSFAVDTTGDGIIGNCLPTVNNWATDCDQIIKADGLLSDRHISIKRTDTREMIWGGALLAATTTENGVAGVYTIVIRPVTDPAEAATGGGYLGSPMEEMGYTVRLGPEIRLNEIDSRGNQVRAFNPATIGNDYYEWQFRVSTELDLSPPIVEDVFPGDGVSEARNSVIQINFNEAMDPTGIQGEFSPSSEDGGYYYISGRNIFLKTNSSTVPVGNFALTNGYRTLEFTPTSVCGLNSCGENIYCLPVCNKEGANCAGDPRIDIYQMILKAGRPRAASSFEAVPFSGVMDLAGNALDGDKDNRADVAPTSPPIFNNWKSPDNYWWQFNIRDEIDTTAPYLHTITPGLDNQNVLPNKNLQMVFSKRLRAGSIYGITVDEKPIHPVPLWVRPRAEFFTSASANITTTSVQVLHGSFLDGLRQYYFPALPHTITDVHFNCFYPGLGPGGEGSVLTERPDTYRCDIASGSNCCPVTSTLGGNGVCCGGIARPDAASAESCKIYIKGESL